MTISATSSHYLSTDFWLDLLCVTPFDWFGWISGADYMLTSCSRIPKMLYVSALDYFVMRCILQGQRIAPTPLP